MGTGTFLFVITILHCPTFDSFVMKRISNPLPMNTPSLTSPPKKKIIPKVEELSVARRFACRNLLIVMAHFAYKAYRDNTFAPLDYHLTAPYSFVAMSA